MKLLQQLMEMAKSKSKRSRENKNARKQKTESPTANDMNNPVAKFAQQSGAGAHKAVGKFSKGKTQRKEGKKQIKQYLDN